MKVRKWYRAVTTLSATILRTAKKSSKAKRCLPRRKRKRCSGVCERGFSRIRHHAITHEPHSPSKHFPPLSDGRGDRPCLASHFARYPTRRVCRHHGPIRLGQIDPDESHRLPGQPHCRRV